MSGLLGFMFGAAASVVMAVILRWLAGFPFGARRVKDAIAPWAPASGGLRAARGFGGAFGWYLGAALALAIATKVAGVNVFDDTSMRVNVTPDGPAARAGIRKGDRVVMVEDEPIRDWNQLRWVIAKRGGETTRVTIERNGARSVVEAVPAKHPDGRARLMVGPYTEEHSAGLGEAISTGLTGPPRIVAAAGRGVVRIFAGKEHAELSGPVQIASEASKVPGIALGMKLGAAVTSYVWPLIILLSLVLAFIRGSSKKA